MFVGQIQCLLYLIYCTLFFSNVVFSKIQITFLVVSFHWIKPKEIKKDASKKVQHLFRQSPLVPSWLDIASLVSNWLESHWLDRILLVSNWLLFLISDSRVNLSKIDLDFFSIYIME